MRNWKCRWAAALAAGLLIITGRANEPVPAVAPSTSSSMTTIAVNCGGPVYRDRLGRVFQRDQAYTEDAGWGYVGGQSSMADGDTEIRDAVEPDVYRSDRWGFDAYRFDMAPGIYRVTLHVAEFHFTRPGQRVFDVMINGRRILPEFDPVGRVGANTAFLHEQVVETGPDGVIEITTRELQDRNKLSAVMIEPAQPDAVPPPVPSISAVYPGEGAVGLEWEPVPAPDEKGYHVYRGPSDAERWTRISTSLVMHAWFREDGLTDGSNVRYRVSAVDVFGNESDMSEPVTATPQPVTPDQLRTGINVGGGKRKGPSGSVLRADRAYNPANGMGYLVPGDLEPAEEEQDRDAFVSRRAGKIAYRLDLPPGIYRVVLGFQEDRDREAGDRLFDVMVNGFRATHRFDVAGSYGAGMPVTLARTVRVEGDGLQVELVPVWQKPILSLVEVQPVEPDTEPPAKPEVQQVIARDRVVHLAWPAAAEDDVMGYRVLRAVGDSGAFRPVNDQLLGRPAYTDYDVENDQTYRYDVVAVDASGNESEGTSIVSARPVMPDDDALLDQISRAAFHYFETQIDPGSYLTLDKNVADKISVAATGFGLSALIVGAERGWMSRDEAEKRAFTMLDTLLSHTNNRVHGMFFHYLEGDGSRSTKGYEDVTSTIDTALLLWGALSAGEYFEGRVREAANRMMDEVNWDAYANKSRKMVAMAYNPPAQRYDGLWDYYTDEAILVTLLGIMAPRESFRLDPGFYYGFKRERKTYMGIPDIICTWPGALFTYTFAHCWIDFKALGSDNPAALGFNADLQADWFDNTRKAVRANRAFCVALSDRYKTFGENAWGLTACSGPGGRYLVPGSPPCGGSSNPEGGMVAPYGAGMSVPFEPELALAALRNFYTMPDEKGRKRLWRDEFDGGFGLVDAYSIDLDFLSDEIHGINHGPMLLLIENYRSGLLWRTVMKNERVRNALAAVGYTVP